MGLGCIEIDYGEPVSAGLLNDHLQKYGPGVVAVVFGCTDAESLLPSVKQFPNTSVTKNVDTYGQVEASVVDVWQISCRKIIGFDIGLEKMNESMFKGGSRPCTLFIRRCDLLSVVSYAGNKTVTR